MYRSRDTPRTPTQPQWERGCLPSASPASLWHRLPFMSTPKRGAGSPPQIQAAASNPAASCCVTATASSAEAAASIVFATASRSSPTRSYERRDRLRNGPPFASIGPPPPPGPPRPVTASAAAAGTTPALVGRRGGSGHSLRRFEPQRSDPEEHRPARPRRRREPRGSCLAAAEPQRQGGER